MKSSFGRCSLSLFLVVVMCLGLIPAGFAADLDGYNMTLTPSGEQTLTEGGTLDLTASITQNGAGVNVNAADIIWTTSDGSVATVSGGRVTAVKAGTATITASYRLPDQVQTPDTGESEDDDTGSQGQTLEASCQVRVNAAVVNPTDFSVSISPSSASLLTKETVNLGVDVTSITPSNADKSGITYTWTSNDPNIVSVPANNTGSGVTVTAQSKGTATITVTARCGSITRTATCTVTVTTSLSNLALTPSSSITLDPGRQSTVIATPNPDDPDMTVSWSSADPSVATAARQSADGRTGIISALSPGEVVITASAGEGSNVRTNTLTVSVSGITLADPPSTVEESGTVLLPGVNRYGAAKNGTISWQSSNPAVAQISGSSVAGRGPGTATITAYVGTYEASFNINVSANSEVTIEAGSLRVDQTLPFKGSLLEQIAAQAPGGLSHVTGLSVPTSQGTLYYRYTSSDEPNEGVAQNGSYYYSPKTGQKGLADITFVPNPTYTGGTVTISYTVVTTTNQNYACRILLDVTPNEDSDVYFTATNYDPAVFNSEEFSKVCQLKTGNALDYVIFSLPPANQGTLYFDYVSADNYGGRVTAGTQYRLKDLDSIAFVPANGFTGTATVYYTARSVGARGTAFTGRALINVSRETIDSSNNSNVGYDGVYYNISRGSTVTFNDEDFNDYCTGILAGSRTLNHIQFDALPSSSQGTLYYNYRTSSSTGSLASAGISYYYGTRSPRLDWITFVPAEDFSGTVRIPFTGWDVEGHRFTGTVEINVRVGGGSGDILYTCSPGRTVKLNVEDFRGLCQDLTGRTLSYIILQDLPNRDSEGSFYHNTTRVSATGTRYYNSSGSYRVGNLSFQASSSFSGVMDVPFIGYAVNGDSFTGVLTIESVSNGGGDSIRYSTDYDTAAVFDRADFDELSRWMTRYNISSVKFEIPAASRGDLYRNYRSSSSKGTRITSNTTSISASSLSQVAFVPAAGFTGTVLIDFTATATSNGGTFDGTVEIEVGRPSAAVTASYATRTAPVSFRAEDLRRSGYTLKSIQITGVPSSSEGHLYYRYTSPTQAERQVNVNSTYNVSGSNLISDITFVPRAGFSGTVTIPYIGTNSNNSTFEGEVIITVSPTRTSSHYNDMSGYTDQERAAVDYLYENGIAVGVGNGQYGPEQFISRGEFAVMVYNAFNISPNYGSYFNDVSGGAYYAQAVNSLYAANIVSGIGNGAYAPNDRVSRQDAICMVQRALQRIGWSSGGSYTGLLSGYTDGWYVSDYAQGPVSNAMAVGYLPLSSGQIRPRDSLTRVDMAQIIHRVLTY